MTHILFKGHFVMPASATDPAPPRISTEAEDADSAATASVDTTTEPTGMVEPTAAPMSVATLTDAVFSSCSRRDFHGTRWAPVQ